MTPTPALMRASLLQCKASRNPRALWSWVWHQTGVRLHWRVITLGHSTPFGFLADCFFNDGRDVAAWSCRSGGKTLSASILAALEYTAHDGLQGRVLSGSLDQARNLYGYWQKWCDGPLGWRLNSDVTRHITRVGGGKFEILAASQTSVRGPKVQLLIEDEVDEIDPSLDATAAGMIATTDERAGRTIYASTWHRADGLMSKLVDKCPDNGVSLHRWNLWESIAQCPEDRHDNGRGCESCPLADACVAKAQDVHKDVTRRVGIAAEATGLYRIPDVMKVYLKVGLATWEAEYLCKRPSVEGLVYKCFDEETHACTDPPPEMTIYRAIDWGLNVFVCLWIGSTGDGRYYVLDTYRAEVGTLAQHAEYINNHRLQAIADTYCDPAGRNRNDQTGQSNVDVFRSFGIPCTYTLSPRLRDVHNGIGMVRGLLEPASGPPRLYYVPNQNNRAYVKAMQSYRNRKVNGIYVDQPQDPQDYEHIPDALRYFTVNRDAPSGVVRVQLGAH